MASLLLHDPIKESIMLDVKSLQAEGTLPRRFALFLTVFFLQCVTKIYSLAYVKE